MSKKLFWVVCILLALSMLAACAPAPAQQPAAQAPAAQQGAQAQASTGNCKDSQQVGS